ncbi:Fis family transcriptional regulator [Psychromonas sp. psych-6C06]|uniref:Fis family transcriptional regulator n=1 Tax=Psychromonas sp. psych-6C06 TaxID=2058089 RepID=UPI000C3455E4|nr:Fis family transcriptional regulator [Psychromonas sp. psych-6C06]PKF60826.1 Fis family transcriptional regulator [Psychromonas sp. psych-6C06]
MRKNDKKLDNALRQTLTEVCEFALDHCEGYQWISHTVNYNNFPQSLRITCMFKDQQSADNEAQQGQLLQMIVNRLNSLSIQLKKPKQQICFESE